MIRFVTDFTNFKKGLAVRCDECNLVYDPERYKCPHFKNAKIEVEFT